MQRIPHITMSPGKYMCRHIVGRDSSVLDLINQVVCLFLQEPAAISATPAGAAPIAGGEKFEGFTFVVGDEVLSVTEGTCLE